MHADLERLIALQRLDTTAQDAERRLAEEPDRLRAIDARIEARRQTLAQEKARLTSSQEARRALEKEVSVHQGRLSKFRDQAMAVKTNQEYHAIQHEIAFAQSEIKGIEDRILERMIEADELTSACKRAESELTAELKSSEADKRALAAEQTELKALLDRLRDERRTIVASLDPQLLATFELVARRRNGVAVAEARDGVCTICHVRLRPQIFNTIRRNEDILRCDSCGRILYYAPHSPAPSVTETAP
jgi:predicted  nucleic acid-binding Zn-ribbon protein